MRRVVIASNDRSFPQNFLSGYRSHGIEPILGIGNLIHRPFCPDVFHLMWPEEFSRFQIPSAKVLANTETVLRNAKKSPCCYKA